MTIPKWPRLRLLATLLPILALPAHASSNPARQDWSKVSSLRTGQEVVLKLHRGMGEKVEGTFVASGPTSVTVRVASYKSESTEL